MESDGPAVVQPQDGSVVFSDMRLADGIEGPLQGGRGSAGSVLGAAAPSPPLGRMTRASYSSGDAYGGVEAHEATKSRSRDAQRKFRQRQKVSCVYHWELCRQKKWQEKTYWYWGTGVTWCVTWCGLV